MEKISRGKLEEYEYQQLHSKGIKKLEQAPIYIDDTAALNIFEFRAKARRLVNKHQVKMIIIDYLQLMSGLGDRNSNREQEISNISRSLKALAKTYFFSVKSPYGLLTEKVLSKISFL